MSATVNFPSKGGSGEKNPLENCAPILEKRRPKHQPGRLKTVPMTPRRPRPKIHRDLDR